MGFSTYLVNTVLGVIGKDSTSCEREAGLLDKASFLMEGQFKNNKEIITIFAVGIAAANADKQILEEEKDVIYSIAKSIRPINPKVKTCVKKMLANPSSDLESILVDAYEVMTEKNMDEWSLFQSKLVRLVEEVVKADGVITEGEKIFIRQFEAYF